MNLNNKTLVIIGGTGSFGKEFLAHVLENHKNINQVRILSRDELKQFELKASLTSEELTKVKFFIGNVRNQDRLNDVFSGADIVIHAAAMKHVSFAEENPEECFLTNIQGTQNVIRAAVLNRVKQVVALSTDKAVLPINVYGSSKLFLERLIIAANLNPNNRETNFSVVRYANVLGSRGSVVPFFIKKRDSGILPITDFNMTRFSITLQDSVDLVVYALTKNIGGEVIIPKAPSYKITTVAKAIAPYCKQVEVGIRSGEKLSEIMISRFEASRTLEIENFYIVTPELSSTNIESFQEIHGGNKVVKDFEYDSATNSVWLSEEELKAQMSELNQY